MAVITPRRNASDSSTRRAPGRAWVVIVAAIAGATGVAFLVLATWRAFADVGPNFWGECGSLAHPVGTDCGKFEDVMVSGTRYAHLGATSLAASLLLLRAELRHKSLTSVLWAIPIGIVLAVPYFVMAMSTVSHYVGN